jgi:fatty-acyl-CoA synthase
MFDRHYKVWPEGAPKQLTLPKTSVYTNLEISALRYPDKAAIVYYGTEISYREFNQAAQALAGYLQHLGVKKGDRVLLFMQNSPQWMIAYYGIMRADAVVVPVNPMNRTQELEHYLSDTGAAVAICGQELYGAIEPLIGIAALRHVIVAAYADYVRKPTDLRLPEAVSVPRQPIERDGAHLWSDALAAGHEPGAHTAGPDDLSVFPYSSGTTGAPKGCMHTHRSVMSTLMVGTVWMSSGGADAVVLTTLPLFHVTGMQGSMNTPIYAGATMVVMTRWDRTTAGKLIERYRVTSWTNISTMAIDFLSNPDVDSFDLSSLNRIGGGGAAMPAAVAAKLHELTGLNYQEGYGLSETIAPTHINPPQAPKAQCLGIPVCSTDARVMNVETGEECGPGEVGEIIVNGPQVFQGYWNNPSATADAFIEFDDKRFFRTGDLGRYDEDGYFFIVDRLKRMINAAGFKVWPTEVESMMYNHPAIQEVCVIASPHPRRGETVKALVVLRADQQGKVREQEIIDWCKANMAAYKCPEIVSFVEDLPKSPTGKLMWRVLQEQEREAAVAAANG